MLIGEYTKDLRQTGRSTRLFNDSIRLAELGKEVHVVTTNSREFSLRLHDLDRLNITNHIHVRSHIPPMFNWVHMQREGDSGHTVWLIDHYLIESNPQFSRMFEMMTRYNN